jgi:hypothetical protein
MKRLLFFLPLLAACGADGADGEIVDSEEEELATSDSVRVIQLNPYYAGAFDPGRRIEDGRRPPKTFGTAKRFAAMVAEKDPDATVIGMEEAESRADAEVLRASLEATTRRRWSMLFHGSPAGGGNERAIYYRPDTIELVRDFGSIVIDRVDGGSVKRAYAAGFSGALFRKRNTDRRFGLFVGKLVWGGAKIDGREVGDGDRLREWRDTVKPWIARTMQPWPKASRIITTDMNDDYGSDVHDAINLDYEDAAVKTATSSGGKRLDYVFWDRDSGPKAKLGFIVPPRTSEDFGSDHRYVSARVRIRSATIPPP